MGRNTEVYAEELFMACDIGSRLMVKTALYEMGVGRSLLRREFLFQVDKEADFIETQEMC